MGKMISMTKAFKRVETIDDETGIGEGVTIVLKPGWHFYQTDHRVGSFDNFKEAQLAVRDHSYKCD